MTAIVNKKLLFPVLSITFVLISVLFVTSQISHRRDLRDRAYYVSDDCQAECPAGTLLTSASVNLSVVIEETLKRVSLSWSFSGSGTPSGFRIYRANQDGQFIYLHSVCGSSYSYYDYSANPGLSYRYKVVAFSVVDLGEYGCQESSVDSPPILVTIPPWGSSVDQPVPTDSPGDPGSSCSPAASCGCPPRIVSGAVFSDSQNADSGNAPPGALVTLDVSNRQNPACYSSVISDNHLWRVTKVGSAGYYSTSSVAGDLLVPPTENYHNPGAIILGMPFGQNWQGTTSQKISLSGPIQIDKIKTRIYWHQDLPSGWVQARIVNSDGTSLTHQDQWGNSLWSSWVYINGNSRSGPVVDRFYSADFIFDFWEKPLLQPGTYHLDFKSNHDSIRKARLGTGPSSYQPILIYGLATQTDNGQISYLDPPKNGQIRWQVPVGAQVGDQFILTPIAGTVCGHSWCKSVNIIIPPPTVLPDISYTILCDDDYSPDLPSQVTFGDTIPARGRGLLYLSITEEEYDRLSRPDPATLIRPEFEIEKIRLALAVEDLSQQITQITPWFSTEAIRQPPTTESIGHIVGTDSIPVLRFIFPYLSLPTELTIPPEDDIPIPSDQIEKFTLIIQVLSQGQWRSINQ